MNHGKRLDGGCLDSQVYSHDLCEPERNHDVAMTNISNWLFSFLLVSNRREVMGLNQVQGVTRPEYSGRRA